MAKSYRRRIRIKNRTIASPTFYRKKDADDWYDRMKRKKQFMRFGFVIDDSNDVTFMEFSKKFMRKRVENYPKATYGSDDQRLRDYLLPSLGDMPIGKIKSAQIKAVLNDITSKGLSPSTRTRVKALASVIFNAALNEDPPLVQFNPVTGIKFEERRIGKKKPSYLKDSVEVVTYLNDAKKLGRIHFLMASLGIMAGLRKSEMLALIYRDIDSKNCIIRVSSKVEQATLTVKKGTKRGEEVVRDIPASPILFKIISDFRKSAKYSKDTDFLFARDSDGRFMNPRELNELEWEIREVSGLTVTVHGLRHTFGREFAAKSSNLKALQAILGHASSATTDIYSELSGKRLKDYGDIVRFEIGDSE